MKLIFMKQPLEAWLHHLIQHTKGLRSAKQIYLYISYGSESKQRFFL
jgi:hypothetical protein